MLLYVLMVNQKITTLFLIICLLLVKSNLGSYHLLGRTANMSHFSNFYIFYMKVEETGLKFYFMYKR